MTAAGDDALPRWGGITEPMTVFTNIVLGGFALILAARLGVHSAAEGVRAASALAGGLLATAIAAMLGAVAHGLDPRTDAVARERMWRGALYATGFIGAGTVASVAFFAARGSTRTAILTFAALKLVVYLVNVTRRPEFRIAVADYAGALAILLAGAAYGMIRWHLAAAPWLIAGVAVSLIAGLVQARRVALHRHFNHNDLYHVIQMVGLYMFYRGGVMLVDR
jgi:hypothetical protein